MSAWYSDTFRRRQNKRREGVPLVFVVHSFSHSLNLTTHFNFNAICTAANVFAALTVPFKPYVARRKCKRQCTLTYILNNQEPKQKQLHQ